MKILVLGSSGQIGQPLAKYFRKLNHQVVEFDNFSNSLTDLRIPHILDTILPTIDFVFFLAFDAGGSVYLKTYQDSYEFISNNIKIMDNTFESLRKYKTPFIFASSQMATMGHSSYGRLKHIGEKYTHCLNGKIVRFWNVYGHERDLHKSHVITDFILMARRNHRIDMKTTGEESRQFLYSEDCCECLAILLDKFNEHKEREYDITSFEWIKIVDVARLVASNFDDCLVCRGEESDEVQKDSLREPDKNILKYWKPKTPLEVGVKNIINGYKD